MAKYHFAQVYYQDNLVGLLKEESGNRTSFTYESSYLDSRLPEIAHTLPLQQLPFSYEGLPPFFDNLVAEGWMEDAQIRLLGKRKVSRFELLMAFGMDCAGAVYIVDPEPAEITKAQLDVNNQMDMAVLTSRASLSGVQPKLAIVKEDDYFRPAKLGELSTHIGKFPSKHHNDLVINEYLTTAAFKALLPDDAVAEMSLGGIQGISQPALIIKRFDRANNGRIHFEEFNQLLGRRSTAKYNGSYREMADFIQATPKTLKTEVYKLFQRILAGIILGNTDMHFKNFAMMHTENGLRLTPSYDQVAAVLYQYKTMALKISGKADMQIGNLKASNIVNLGKEFGLNAPAINMACTSLGKNLAVAKDAIRNAKISIGNISDGEYIKNQLIDFMEKRWNGTFALIGKNLSKKQ